ncbi:hypothetical protein GCM10012278_70360 [Nonomuraea glycinis]|uniref:Uncharacterized protein n=1 Tax=Nonomuraea glycinis TaxID=2047744 RepID=A0A918EA05_9ACTN|nr:hypothetical protein GCM10012278_70360 [Nonomuraea glycinis]
MADSEGVEVLERFGQEAADGGIALQQFFEDAGEEIVEGRGVEVVKVQTCPLPSASWTRPRPAVRGGSDTTDRRGGAALLGLTLKKPCSR